MARPMPRLPPEMNTVLPSRVIGTLLPGDRPHAAAHRRPGPQPPGPFGIIDFHCPERTGVLFPCQLFPGPGVVGPSARRRRGVGDQGAELTHGNLISNTEVTRADIVRAGPDGVIFGGLPQAPYAPPCHARSNGGPTGPA